MKSVLIWPIGMVGRCVAGAALVSAPRAVFSPLAVAISRAITSRGAAGAARPSAAGHLAGSSPVTIAAAAKVEAKLGLPAAHAGGGLDAMTSTGAGALASQPRGLGGISSLAGGVSSLGLGAFPGTKLTSAAGVDGDAAMLDRLEGAEAALSALRQRLGARIAARQAARGPGCALATTAFPG